MEVQIKLGGRMLTGEERFLITQHSGAPEDLPDVLREELTDYEQSLLDGGDWVMLVDDTHYLIEAGDHPPVIYIRGEAEFGILNEHYHTDDHLVVAGSDPNWSTVGDGDTIEMGDFHPFLIEAGALI